ncbi:MAG: hypothetical protein J6J00_07765 [Treponema sp.]|nr:hypothetical protein [Treponema sp.]
MDGNLANEGAVEGADRRSATVTAKPAAAAKKEFSEKSENSFFILKFIELKKSAAAGFETK